MAVVSRGGRVIDLTQQDQQMAAGMQGLAQAGQLQQQRAQLEQQRDIEQMRQVQEMAQSALNVYGPYAFDMQEGPVIENYLRQVGLSNEQIAQMKDKSIATGDQKGNWGISTRGREVLEGATAGAAAQAQGQGQGQGQQERSPSQNYFETANTIGSRVLERLGGTVPVETTFEPSFNEVAETLGVPAAVLRQEAMRPGTREERNQPLDVLNGYSRNQVDWLRQHAIAIASGQNPLQPNPDGSYPLYPAMMNRIVDATPQEVATGAVDVPAPMSPQAINAAMLEAGFPAPDRATTSAPPRAPSSEADPAPGDMTVEQFRDLNLPTESMGVPGELDSTREDTAAPSWAESPARRARPPQNEEEVQAEISRLSTIIDNFEENIDRVRIQGGDPSELVRQQRVFEKRLNDANLQRISLSESQREVDARRAAREVENAVVPDRYDIDRDQDGLLYLRTRSEEMPNEAARQQAVRDTRRVVQAIESFTVDEEKLAARAVNVAQRTNVPIEAQAQQGRQIMEEERSNRYQMLNQVTQVTGTLPVTDAVINDTRTTAAAIVDSIQNNPMLFPIATQRMAQGQATAMGLQKMDLEIRKMQMDNEVQRAILHGPEGSRIQQVADEEFDRMGLQNDYLRAQISNLITQGELMNLQMSMAGQEAQEVMSPADVERIAVNARNQLESISRMMIAREETGPDSPYEHIQASINLWNQQYGPIYGFGMQFDPGSSGFLIFNRRSQQLSLNTVEDIYRMLDPAATDLTGNIDAERAAEFAASLE